MCAKCVLATGDLPWVPFQSYFDSFLAAFEFQNGAKIAKKLVPKSDLISELREWKTGDKDNPNAVVDEDGIINCTPHPAMDTKEGRARACQVRNYYDKSEFPITNDELLIRFGERQLGGISSISDEISPERVLGDDYKGESQEKKYNDLRKKIHGERGAKVKIDVPTMKKWKDYYNNECNPTQTPTPANLPSWCGEFDEDDFKKKGKYSKKFIVHEEAEEYELSHSSDRLPLGVIIKPLAICCAELLKVIDQRYRYQGIRFHTYYEMNGKYENQCYDEDDM